ncbi:Citrate (Si)-synthase [Haladaptatus paucihalophilus DX253]|uniref:Citrate synthase n=1 Tax=Haladaptatus paucihalophilus DX253 TaxID=797209 RepID=E7QXM0_HALPU|nr:citrate synthase [Haladaptatus paucihalophilus]EFW90705.1 Citrate (Si)-synthase [Haladaptatus paucihalophilus DX253]SHL19029.1 citrate synthase [Haladaptatus paucihalophilus DX253]
MTDQTINEGLENVIVAETRRSYIDGDAGELVIAGYPLAELAEHATFEETVFLLWNDRLPTAEELASFRADLAAYRDLSDATLDLLRAAAADDADPMDALRMGVAAATLGHETDGPEDEARLLVAQLPTIVAAYWRLRNGNEPVAPDGDLSHAANYLYMLTGEKPTDAETRGLETYLNSVVDHGLNASTFSGRAIVSTETDLVSAVTGAVGALKGPLHGGAPGPVLDMLLDIHNSGDAAGYVEDKLDEGERIMGFGHRVYNVRDPRAAVLSSAAESFYESGGERAFFETAKTVETTTTDLLSERRPDLSLATNVEFYTAVLLHGIGIPSELFTTTFAIARVGGWTAHCLEQLDDNRIIRPRSAYVGGENREWQPVEER